jgi:hypothetical protein
MVIKVMITALQAMILEGNNGKRLSCRKINKFADLFITNMTQDKFNSYAKVNILVICRTIILQFFI